MVCRIQYSAMILLYALLVQAIPIPAGDNNDLPQQQSPDTMAQYAQTYKNQNDPWLAYNVQGTRDKYAPYLGLPPLPGPQGPPAPHPAGSSGTPSTAAPLIPHQLQPPPPPQSQQQHPASTSTLPGGSAASSAHPPPPNRFVSLPRPPPPPAPQSQQHPAGTSTLSGGSGAPSALPPPPNRFVSLPRPRSAPADGKWWEWKATWIHVGEVTKNGIQSHVNRCPFCFYVQVISTQTEASRSEGGRNSHLATHSSSAASARSNLNEGSPGLNDFRFVGWSGKIMVTQCNLCYMLFLKYDTASSHVLTCSGRRGRQS